MYSHVLTIGCTGMLREATATLAGRCKALTSVARTMQSLHALDAAITNPACTHRMLPLDWSQPDAFVATVAEGVRASGPPDLVLAWLHDDRLGPGLARALAHAEKACGFFQVRGSAAANPAERADAFPQRGDIPSTIDYHQIILGFHVGVDGSRWLRDTEICAGVLDAIQHPQAVAIVSIVEPWSKHP